MQPNVNKNSHRNNEMIRNRTENDDEEGLRNNSSNTNDNIGNKYYFRL